MRLGLFSSSGPHWPTTGKFDKIAFSLSASQYLLGITACATVDHGIPVDITIKVTDISGSDIASKSMPYTFARNQPYFIVYFDEPIFLAAGQQYIAATLVEAPTMPLLLRFYGGSSVVTCTNPHVTVTFSNVPANEMADSNGSTVSEGLIPHMDFKSP